MIVKTKRRTATANDNIFSIRWPPGSRSNSGRGFFVSLLLRLLLYRDKTLRTFFVSMRYFTPSATSLTAEGHHRHLGQ